MMSAALAALARRGRASALATALACGALALGACDLTDSASVEELLKRAETHRAAGEMNATVIELKNALQKDGQNAVARLMLGEAFIDLGDSQAAEIELQRAAQLGAPAARTALLLGETKMLQARFDLVLREHPDNEALPPEERAKLLALRGRAHTALGQRVFADEAFKAALGIDPKSVESLLGLARLSPSTGPVARGYAERAAAIDPQNVRMLSMRGEMAFAARDFDSSEAFYRQVLVHRKDDMMALHANLGIARAHIAAGKLREAIGRLNYQLRLAPMEPVAHYLRALAAFYGKDYETAKTHSEVALHISPTHAPSMFVAGAANYELGQYEQALLLLTGYLAEAPNNLEARKLLAATLLKVGQPAKAVATLRPIAEAPRRRGRAASGHAGHGPGAIRRSAIGRKLSGARGREGSGQRRAARAARGDAGCAGQCCHGHRCPRKGRGAGCAGPRRYHPDHHASAGEGVRQGLRCREAAAGEDAGQSQRLHAGRARRAEPRQPRRRAGGLPQGARDQAGRPQCIAAPRGDGGRGRGVRRRPQAPQEHPEPPSGRC
jgi:tetratricopeptide (TPR) repeat protein